MPSKAMDVYEKIRDDVVKLRLRTDELLNEKDLAEQYNVSKTPVREALAMLVQDGYLKKIPRVGYLIREVTDEEYYKLIYLRYTLEKGVVQWIIERCGDDEIASLKEYCTAADISYRDLAGVNYDFHMTMARLTKNEYLISSVQNVFDRIIRVPSVTLFQQFQEEPHGYHLQLIDAMLARDLRTALELIRHECQRDDDKDFCL